MWRNIASNALTIFVVLLFVIGGVILWGQRQYHAPGPLSQAICLKVERGSNMARVSRDLEETGAISSGAIFPLRFSGGKSHRWPDSDGLISMGLMLG